MALYGVRLVINLFDLCIYRRYLEEFIGNRKTSMEFSVLLLIVCELIGSAVNQYDHKPRNITLDALAQYIGYNNYAEFTKWLKDSTKYNSSFFMAQQVISNDLQEGKEISIGWSPNRILRLRYLGESTYEVLKSENSKLQIGDKFVTGCFIKEQPLYLPYIERKGKRTAAFVAGRNGGLTLINVMK